MNQWRNVAHALGLLQTLLRRRLRKARGGGERRAGYGDMNLPSPKPVESNGFGKVITSLHSEYFASQILVLICTLHGNVGGHATADIKCGSRRMPPQVATRMTRQ